MVLIGTICSLALCCCICLEEGSPGAMKRNYLCNFPLFCDKLALLMVPEYDKMI